MYKSIKQSYMSEHIIIQEKKSSFAINSWQLSIKEELINIADVGVSFYDKSKFENDIIRKSMNGIDWIFNANENKHKNLHCILDDDYDDYDRSTCDTFTINKILYAYHNDNALKAEEYTNDDIINSGYYSLINRIKNIF